MGLKDGIANAAKAAAVTTAVVGSGIAADVRDSGYVIADPVQRAEVSALAADHDAIEAAADTDRAAKEVAEATDVGWEQTTSLDDPPDWVSEPTELQAQIADDLANSWDLGVDAWAEDSSGWSEAGSSGAAASGGGPA